MSIILWGTLQASQHGNTVWMDRLLGFYEGMLRDGQVLPASSSIDQAPEQPAISANVYSNVLSGARAIVPSLPSHLFEMPCVPRFQPLLLLEHQ
jgi:hypothetical protein